MKSARISQIRSSTHSGSPALNSSRSCGLKLLLLWRLVPVFVDGSAEHLQQKIFSYIKMAAPIHRMDRVHLDLSFFAVPVRLLCGTFPKN